MMMIMAEADENGDNVIQYDEFVPVCVELLQAFRVSKLSFPTYTKEGEGEGYPR